MTYVWISLWILKKNVLVSGWQKNKIDIIKDFKLFDIPFSLFTIALLKCQTYFSKSLVRTFVYIHVSVCRYVHTRAGENRGQNLVLDPLKLEL